MDNYELHQKAHDMAQGTTQYQLARELVKARERIAERERELDELAAWSENVSGFLREVKDQIPEKPDHWGSCSQCERNSDEAEDHLDSKPAAALARRDKMVAADALEKAADLADECDGGPSAAGYLLMDQAAILRREAESLK